MQSPTNYFSVIQIGAMVHDFILYTLYIVLYWVVLYSTFMNGRVKILKKSTPHQKS